MRKTSFKEIIFERRNRWLRHVLLWLIIFVFLVFGINEPGNLPESFVTFFVYIPVIGLYTYGIIYWLIPRFLIKERYFAFFIFYCCWCAFALTLIFIATYYVFNPMYNIERPQFTAMETYRTIFALNRFARMNMFAMFFVFIKFFKFWYIEQQQKMQAEKERISAELELLRAQLHPHFLFNTLNNLYLLVREKSDKAPKMLLRLSGLLSYVLYECKADEVLLSKEISVLKDYVALEQERYGERLDVSLNFSGDIEDRMIVPMLFQPFIENAFKHGTSEQLGKVWMSIDLSVRKNQLYFKIINSFDKHNNIHLDGKGIGINNVRKRLELLYPGKFELQNGIEQDLYIVSLTIELHGLPVAKNLPTENMPTLNHA